MLNANLVVAAGLYDLLLVGLPTAAGLAAPQLEDTQPRGRG